MSCWLLKPEPEEYSWQDLVKESVTIWDGVREIKGTPYLIIS